MNKHQRVKQAIDAYKRGEMVIVMDDEDRENEGDLVLAGIFCTPEKINFMTKFARGLICAAIPQSLANALNLPPMVDNNDSNHHTAFTISIDAKDAKTGISAFERSLTIELMCKDNALPDDFVRPGHIFPLVAKDGGVLVRTGHTEAGVDMCRIAGLKPVSVICEIMKEDGSMAKRGDKFLRDFAKTHNLKILYIADLISFRMENDNLLSIMKQEKSSFLNHDCQKITFKDHISREHFVLCFGLGAFPLVKFQLIKNNLDFLEEDFDFFMLSAQKIAKNGGLLVFLNDDGQKGEIVKNIGIGSQILKNLKINEFVLLSNSNKEYNALGGFGIKIIKTLGVKDLSDL